MAGGNSEVVARMSIVNYANAFFGAFFGFWCKSFVDPLIDNFGSASAFLATFLIFSTVSIHILGMWNCKDLQWNTLIREALKKYALNWFSVCVFGVSMALFYFCTNDRQVQFASGYGIFLYVWWVTLTFVLLSITGEAEPAQPAQPA